MTIRPGSISALSTAAALAVAAALASPISASAASAPDASTAADRAQSPQAARSPQEAQSAQAAPKMFRLVLRTPNCPRCRLTILKYRPGKAPWQRTKNVQNRRAVFNFARARTKGLQIIVDSPRRTVMADGAGIRLTALRYQNRKPGAKVTPKQARRAQAGFHCWRGVTRKQATITLRVDPYRARDAYTNELGTDIRAYALKGTRTIGRVTEAYRGALGAQDWPPCN